MEATMREARIIHRRTYQAPDRTSEERTERERRKHLWLDPVDTDLATPEALKMAGEFHVSLRLVRQIVGLVVNLDSFLDIGYVYASQRGLAGCINGANDQPMSDRQVRRGIAFLKARNHLRVVERRGARNRMFPLYRAAVQKPVFAKQSEDMVSSENSRHVLTFEPHVLRKQEKPEGESPPPRGDSNRPIEVSDREAEVPFSELWGMIRRGHRGAAMGAYLKLTSPQTHEVRRQLVYQLEDGPLPEDFPVAATVFNMIARGQSVRIATAATATPKQVLVLEGTEDWDEWQSHLRKTTGRGSPVCKAGGWYFPSRRPRSERPDSGPPPQAGRLTAS
jgi:hypothetical protein